MIVSSTNASRERLTSRAEVAVIERPIARPVPAKSAAQVGEISLGKRLRDWKTLAGFAVSAAIIVFFVLTAHLDLATIWAQVQTADVRYLGVALAVYLGAFVFRGLRWQLLLRRADLGEGVKLPPLSGLVEIIYLSWFVNCLVPAKLGDAYRSYLLKKNTGADMSRTLGTVVGERMADVLALVVLLAASGLMIIGKLAGSNSLDTLMIMGGVLVVAIAAVAVGLKLTSGKLAERLPLRWRELFTKFVEGMLRTFRRDIQLPLYTFTCMIWACEVIRIWLVMQAFHITGLAFGVIIFTALAGSLLSTIPLTPGGLGAVEGASVAILTTFGVASSLAGAVAVIDRVINFWSNIPLGGLLYLVSKRK